MRLEWYEKIIIAVIISIIALWIAAIHFLPEITPQPANHLYSGLSQYNEFVKENQ